jgi:hypothetical protein
MDQPQLPQWTPSDVAGMQQFLNTPLGVKFINFLMSGKPRTVIDRGTETAALTGTYVAGYELCIIRIYMSCRSLDQPDVSVKSQDMTKD